MVSRTRKQDNAHPWSDDNTDSWNDDDSEPEYMYFEDEDTIADRVERTLAMRMGLRASR